MMEIEEKIKELFESGKTKPYQIAKELQIDTKDVRKHLREMTEEGKIDNSGTVKRIQKRQEEVERLSKNGKTKEKMAEILNVSIGIIKDDIRHLKAEGKIESKHEIRKKQIRTLYEAEKTQEKIAGELKISPTTVGRYVRELKAEGLAC